MQWHRTDILQGRSLPSVWLRRVHVGLWSLIRPDPAGPRKAVLLICGWILSLRYIWVSQVFMSFCDQLLPDCFSKGYLSKHITKGIRKSWEEVKTVVKERKCLFILEHCSTGYLNLSSFVLVMSSIPQIGLPLTHKGTGIIISNQKQWITEWHEYEMLKYISDTRFNHWWATLLIRVKLQLRFLGKSQVTWQWQRKRKLHSLCILACHCLWSLSPSVYRQYYHL